MSSNTSNIWGVDINDPVLNAETRGPTLGAVLCVCAFLTLVFVALRVYTRLCIVRKMGADDIAIIIVQVLCLGFMFITGMEAYYGLGRHVWTISAQDMAIQQRYLYSVLFVYNSLTNMLKAAILLQYRRIFPTPTIQRICNYSLIFIAIWTVTQITMLALTCSPLTNIVPSMKDHCLPQTPTWLFSSAMNIVTDFAILSIPLPVVARLRMVSKRKKRILIALLSLGFFTCIMSLMRAITLSGRIGNADGTYNAVIPVLWGVAEITCGIVCSCLITLRPFARRFLPGFDDTTDARTARGYELNMQSTAKRSAHVRLRNESISSVEGLATMYRGDMTDRSCDVAIYRGDSHDNGDSGEDDLERAKRRGPQDAGDKLKIYKHQTFETKLSAPNDVGRPEAAVLPRR